jgi:DNA-binding LacI/PurR family transcriptional regulator
MPRTHSKTAFNTFLTTLLMVAADRGTDCYLDPLFRKALTCGHGATWVCSDDKAAIIALNFLRGAKVKVPDQIAIVGFDNWREASEHHISSFDLNMLGFVQQALIMILDEKALKMRPVISEVEGYMVERQTTRR